jgi:hypothetical protein
VAGTKEGKVAWIKADGTMEGEVADLGGTVTQLQMAPDGSTSRHFRNRTFGKMP